MKLLRVIKMRYVLILFLSCVFQVHAERVFDMASFGIVPNGKNLSAKMEKALSKIRTQANGDSVVIRFCPGRYDFYPEKALLREYYISNHAEYYDNAKCRHKVQQNGKRLPDPIATDGKAIV